MKLLNCALYEAKERIGDKRIVFFGAGSWIQSVNYTELMDLKNQFAYVLDNNPKGSVELGDRTLEIYKPERLESEENIVIILTSPVYMYEMFCQLKDMELDDSISCYAFPFMQMVSGNDNIDQELLKTVRSDDKEKHKIPKIIHSFWFSGEPKPDTYQRCVDTWSKILPDYEIKEWNTSNYDWHKHHFVEKAIELEAWAFATDYARLDVLYKYGGIYLDMDVEVLKSFDNLLGNEAIMSFANNVLIDLAVLGAQPGNPLIFEMMHLYDSLRLPAERKGFSAFFQPILVRDVLHEYGIKMNGSLQRVKNATVFPTTFFMPMDAVLYRPYEKSEYNYCVHYDNFGWSFGKDNKKEKKMKDNNLLWNEIGR